MFPKGGASRHFKQLSLVKVDGHDHVAATQICRRLAPVVSVYFLHILGY